jgi:AraC-like DNA-binding protein
LGVWGDNLISSWRRLRERFAVERVTSPPVAATTPEPASTEPERDPADRAFLRRLNIALDAGFDNPDFGVAELAAAMFMDRTHLFRRTREVMDESPSELLRRTRLDRSVPLLREGAGGVGEIAYAVGFNSVSHFCRCFRQRFGVSPSEFRERSAVAG